jgi:hypothetical protein
LVRYFRPTSETREFRSRERAFLLLEETLCRFSSSRKSSAYLDSFRRPLVPICQLKSLSSRTSSLAIAGPVSKADLHSLKIVNDPSHYSLWQFDYDPRREPRQGAFRWAGA